MKDLAHYGYKESFSPFGDPDAQDPDPEVRKRFFGKYRGSVVTNVDPLLQGRLIVRVPDVFGLLPSNWALPCVPLAGPLMGTSFVPPPVGSSVWVEFEQGDPETPIWVGCFWETPETLGEMALIAGPEGTPSVTLETLTSGIGVSDAPTLPPTAGNVSLYAGKGVTSISLNPAGVTITAPAVNIVATDFVTITAAVVTIDGALVVNGDLAVDGAAEVDGDLDVNGAAEVAGDVAVTGALEVVGVAVVGELTAAIINDVPV
jgi:hypothetical protein